MSYKETIEALEQKKASLLASVSKLDEDLAAIKSKIMDAKQRALLDDDYSDPRWFRKINDLRAEKARQRQRLQTEIGAVRDQIKAELRARAETEHATWERSFYKAAVEMLPEQDLIRLRARADLIVAAAVNR